MVGYERLPVCLARKFTGVSYQKLTKFIAINIALCNVDVDSNQMAVVDQIDRTPKKLRTVTNIVYGYSIMNGISVDTSNIFIS